jgi:hypothetical protein
MREIRVDYRRGYVALDSASTVVGCKPILLHKITELIKKLLLFSYIPVAIVLPWPLESIFESFNFPCISTVKLGQDADM